MPSNINMNIKSATFSGLLFLIFGINFLSGIVGGLWLLVVGGWALLLGGIILGVIMPYVYALITSPAFALLLGAEKVKHNKFFLSILLFLASLINNLPIAAWTVFIFGIFLNTKYPLFPLLLSAYATTMSPLSYMVSHESNPGAGSSRGLLYAQINFVALVIFYLLNLDTATRIFLLVITLLIFCILPIFELSSLNLNEEDGEENIDDPLLSKAIAICSAYEKISPPLLQRRLAIDLDNATELFKKLKRLKLVKDIKIDDEDDFVPVGTVNKKVLQKYHSLIQQARADMLKIQKTSVGNEGLISTNKDIDELSLKRELENEINKNKKILLELTEKVEQLKIDLSLIRQEYNIKIGRLYLKLDQLDLEIIKLTKVKKLQEEGYSLKEAKKRVDEETKNKQEKIDQENERINEEQEEKENIPELSEEDMKQLKSLYKDLVKKFHPDLVFDEAEKKKRQEIMKEINKAYREHDLAELKTIAGKQALSEEQEDSIERMQLLLREIINSEERLQQEYKSLEKSEWYQWMMRIQNAKGRDLFQELEEKILDDISKKEITLSKLKTEYEKE